MRASWFSYVCQYFLSRIYHYAGLFICASGYWLTVRSFYRDNSLMTTTPKQLNTEIIMYSVLR